MAMEKLSAGNPETRSADLVQENIDRLKTLFPDLVTEGPDGTAVNVDVLKALIGDETVTDCDEKYGLNWHGKRRARQLALTPSTGTLRPAPEESVEWDTTQNLMIEGDNLEVLKLLQKSYAGRVKLIYIDPPYNTGKDFVYPDDFRDSIANYLEVTGQLEGGHRALSDAEVGGRVHTAWLNMMYPRLRLARSILRQDGYIFVSIDHNELPSLVQMLREIFGEENEIEIFSWVRTRTPAALSIKTKTVTEYIVCFQRSASSDRLLGIEKPAQSANTLLNQSNPLRELVFPSGTPAGFEDCELRPGKYGSNSYDVELLETAEVRGRVFTTPVRLRARFRWSQSYLAEQLNNGVVVRIATKKLLPSYEKASYGREALPNLIDDSVGVGTNEQAGAEVAELLGAKGIVSFPKPLSLLRYLVASCTGDHDIVLDFFAGSGTTGHAVLEQNQLDGAHRRYVLVQLPTPLSIDDKEQAAAAAFCDSLQLPRNLAEITKERLRRAGRRLKHDSSHGLRDSGFRVFKLDASNVRAWDPAGEGLEEALRGSVEHVVPERSMSDLLYEVLLKRGLELTVPIETRVLGKQKVSSVGLGVLMVCLEDRLDQGDVDSLCRGLVEWRKELGPAGATVCVFRDSAFENDVVKTNMAAILEQHGLGPMRTI